MTARPGTPHSFLPREHGATAMLLTPFFTAAIVLARWSWFELASLAVMLGIYAAKDPLVVVARQRFIWKNEHAETAGAMQWLMASAPVILLCGAALLWHGPVIAYVALGAGCAVFCALAVWANVRNKQRAEWFQIASAMALTSTCLLPGLAATQSVPVWTWTLWGLCALQAATGIFNVHARLDARIAAKKNVAPETDNVRASIALQSVMAIAGVVYGATGHHWIAAALILGMIGYSFDLWRQRQPNGLQTALKSIGLQAMTLSILYALMIAAGLWQN